jgi:hypothetical protein
VGPGVNLPFHRDSQHQPTGNRQKIAGCKKREISEPKRSVWVVGFGAGLDRERNGGGPFMVW